MNKIMKWGTTSALALSAVLTPIVVMAAAALPTITPSTSSSPDVGPILQKIATFMLGLAGGLAVIYLIWAGIQYITGGAKGAAAAKDSIVNAIIGIVVIVLAYVIVRVVVVAVGGSVT